MIVSKFIKVSGFALVALVSMNQASFAAAGATSTAGTIGDMLTNVANSFQNFPDILSAFAFMAGIFLAVSGIFKFKDHVDAPHQAPLSNAVKRFLAWGMFFSLPYMYEAVVNTIHAGNSNSLTHGDLAGAGGDLSGGLDSMVQNLMADAYGPTTTVLAMFAWISGMIFLLNGISRLLKTAQDGPRGPAGVGTIVTFLVAGILFSLGDSMGMLSTSLFGDAHASNFASIGSNVISDETDKARVETVINAVMAFVMIVGYIAFIRGWFVMKAFADGTGNASMAQALTFLFGGALAINLGDLVNVLQETLGISGSLSFS